MPKIIFRREEYPGILSVKTLSAIDANLTVS